VVDPVIFTVPDYLLTELEDLDTIPPDDMGVYFDEKAIVEQAEKEVYNSVVL